MGANQSSTVKQEPMFDEKHAEMVAVCESTEKTSITVEFSQEKYLAQSMAELDLTEKQCKDHYSALTPRALDKFSDHFWHDRKNALAMNAIMANDPTQVMVNPQVAVKNQHVFNVKLEVEGAATNQKQSGRCWIFAGTNVLRLAVIRKYKLNEDFELSQNFLFFYGKCYKFFINTNHLFFLNKKLLF